MNNASWKPQANTGFWNSADNWTTGAVPDGTATFSSSSQTTVAFAADNAATVEQIVFSEDAPSFTFGFTNCATTPALTISGEGVSNASTSNQSFKVMAKGVSYKQPQLMFINQASAGGDDISYYAGPESLQQGYGGGIIGFCNNSTAGSASFTVRTGAAAPPKQGSTVGAEVSFSDNSSAGNARFSIYGTLGSDGDTFGNVVFHDSATAYSAHFFNAGGTVSGGDGGNTQFYRNSSAANGFFNNQGATASGANGGDVAFDGNACGAQGYFYNYAASATKAYGGVTSFNNNPPNMPSVGASAGNAFYFNYGAKGAEQGGGGHTEFSAKHGSPTAANASIANYGSELADKSSAGHTIFSISLPTHYFPSAGNATIWNHPSLIKGAAAGFTEFAVYGSGEAGSNVPTANYATIINQGGESEGVTGGYTVFSGTATADSAQLIAIGGNNGGYGGKIIFYDNADGGKASVQLYGNGCLDIGDHSGELSIGALQLNGGGTVETQLGSSTTTLLIKDTLVLKAAALEFYFWKKDSGGFDFNTTYTILSVPNLADNFSEQQFFGNSIDDVEPEFSIFGDQLQVCFKQ